MRHLINTVRLEAACASEEQAFALRQSAAKTLQGRMEQMMEAVYEKHSSPDDWLLIDKITIDLGTIHVTALDREFERVFSEQFEKEFLRTIAHRRDHRPAAEIVRHFLLYGTLPWWASSAELDLDKTCMDALASEPEAMRAFFYKHQSQPWFWDRIAFQFAAATKAEVIAKVEELLWAETLILSWVKRILFRITSSEPSIKNEIRDHLRDVVLQNAAGIIASRGSENILWQIAGDHMSVIFADDPSVVTALSSVSFEEMIPRPYEELHESDASSAAMEPSALPESSPPEEEEVEQYAVTDAGIVLLGPFLKAFFSRLNLLTDGAAWINPQAQQRAALVLRYLVSGQTKTPEYELILEKLLVGIRLHETVPGEFEISELESAEAQELLHSVIEHWSALKNTSIEGLRQTFFRRSGMLKKQGRDWCLYVERMTVDVLLEKLPWGYANLALPWNEYLIVVEW